MKLKYILAIVLGGIGLLSVYLFQNYLDFYTLIFKQQFPEALNYTTDYKVSHWPSYIFNKTMRYLVNDVFAICIIYGLFHQKKYMRFAFYLMIFGLLFLHPTYLLLIYSQAPGFSSAISHLHRIIMNPVLMMLLIPAFYYQKNIAAKKES